MKKDHGRKERIRIVDASLGTEKMDKEAVWVINSLPRKVSSGAALMYLFLSENGEAGEEELSVALSRAKQTIRGYFQELEALGLVRKGEEGGYISVLSLRDQWRARLFYNWATDYSIPYLDRIQRSDGTRPETREEFNELFDAWWEQHKDELWIKHPPGDQHSVDVEMH